MFEVGDRVPSTWSMRAKISDLIISLYKYHIDEEEDWHFARIR